MKEGNKKMKNEKFCPLIKDTCKGDECAWLVPVTWDSDTPPVNPEDFKPHCAIYGIATLDSVDLEPVTDELGRLSSVEENLGKIAEMLDDIGWALEKIYRSK